MDLELPPIRITKCEPQKREPGTIYFTVRPGGLAAVQQYGWLIGVDQSGAVVFNRKLRGTSQDVRVLPGGGVLCSLSNEGLLYEFDDSGNIRAQWHARDKWRDKEPPKGSIELPVFQIHHTVNVLPNGNFLVLDAEERSYDAWPTSTTDRNSPTAKAKIVGDVVREISREGTLLHSYFLLDILDPYRATHGSMGGYWRKRGFPNAYDWSHVNATAYNPIDDSLIFSVRHQDCIIKTGRSDGKLRWILGDHSEWKDQWRQYLLTPKQGLRWQYHQHDCSVTAPGRVLCFDNGTYRAPAFSAPWNEDDNFSRAVEFHVDEADMSVRQTWEYGEHSSERIYACYQGGARRLPATGNTFVTFGGICSDDGRPSSSSENVFCCARLIEVTSSGEVVFDLEVRDSGSESPMAYSAFRSDHRPGA